MTAATAMPAMAPVERPLLLTLEDMHLFCPATGPYPPSHSHTFWLGAEFGGQSAAQLFPSTCML
eukprot:XP_001708047.1 Hypothetical protein GL50803_39197 [Giardia lamblia ATCC 50803]